MYTRAKNVQGDQIQSGTGGADDRLANSKDTGEEVVKIKLRSRSKVLLASGEEAYIYEGSDYVFSASGEKIAKMDKKTNKIESLPERKKCKFLYLPLDSGKNTDEEFAKEINAVVWANFEKFGTACGKDNKEIAYNINYDGRALTLERADDGSGTSDSVKSSYTPKTIVAKIHNHPNDKNCDARAFCSGAWPSMTDVFSLILTNQERDKVTGDKKIPSKVDEYIVDCFGVGSIVRVDGGTGAVKNVARDGEYNPEPYNGLVGIQKCNDADECGKSLKEMVLLPS